jgi:hypothetical protein
MSRWGCVARCVAVLAAVAGSGGCAAGGLAVGPILTAIQIVGDRSVERTVAADLEATRAATVDALSSLSFRVEGLEREGEAWSLKATSAGMAISATLAPVTSRMTRVSLRAEAGRLTADKQTAEQIHDQIAAMLPVSTAERRHPPSDDGRATREALNAVESEIQRLRSEIESSRARQQQPRPASSEAGPAVNIEPGRILTIPLSHGLPVPVASGSAPGDARAPERSPSPIPEQRASLAEVLSPLPAPKPGDSTEAARDGMASGLRPVSGLAPVEAIGRGK